MEDLTTKLAAGDPRLLLRTGTVVRSMVDGIRLCLSWQQGFGMVIVGSARTHQLSTVQCMINCIQGLHVPGHT